MDVRAGLDPVGAALRDRLVFARAYRLSQTARHDAALARYAATAPVLYPLVVLAVLLVVVALVVGGVVVAGAHSLWLTLPVALVVVLRLAVKPYLRHLRHEERVTDPDRAT